MLSIMDTHLGQSAGVWDSTHGCFISATHKRVAEVIADYNANFSLVFIPPKNRDETDTKPYAILDSTPGRKPYIMRFLSDAEMARPQEIVEWMFLGDLSKHRPTDVFDRIQAGEAAEALIQLKEKEDHLAEAQEFGEFVFSSRAKSQWQHNGQTYRN